MEWDKFEFAGRLMGLALMHNMQVNVLLDRAFFLHLAGMVIGLEDIKETEPTLHKFLKELLEGDGFDAADLRFEIDIQKGKEFSLEQLCEDGSLMKVTKENAGKYVHLYLQHRFVQSISKQTSFFAKGLSDMLLGCAVHTSFFQVLSLEDFDLIFGGDQLVSGWKIGRSILYMEEGTMDTKPLIKRFCGSGK